MLRSLLLLATLSTLPAPAQTITGAIQGSIKDPTGLAISGASLTLTQTATGALRESLSNERGDFLFGSVPPGAYTLSVSMQGFKKAERRGIQLSAQETLSIGDITLELGNVAEQVTVSAQGATVQTASAERAGTISSSQVESLAIRGRNVMSLLQLLPGVVDLQDSEQIDRNWNLNVNGNRRNTNGVTMDGATLNAIGNNFNMVVGVSQDAVAEVKILLSNYQAEFGRMSGANISLITKSGSKQFHGLGSYFKRHEQFNANNFFNNRLGAPKPRYRFNTWNYNVGGPIYIPNKFNTNKEKLFFFFSQEYWPLKVTRPIAQLTVPTPLERAGDFSQSLDVNNRVIAITDPTTRTPFPANRIPTARLDSNGLALLKFFPAPNFFDRTISAGRYNYVFQSENQTPQRMETLKIDSPLSSKNTLSINFSIYSDVQSGPIGIASSGGTNWPQMSKTFDNQGKLWIGRYTRIFTPTLVNELNVSYSHRPANDVVDDAEVQRNLRQTVGFNIGQFSAAGNPLKVIPNATFGGVNNPANLLIEGRFPLVTTHDIFTLTNNITYTRAAHTFKAGFYADRYWRNAANAVNFNGDFDFGRNVNNPLDTGYAYSNAALGVFNSYTEASNRPFSYFRLSNIEWFAQDNWKITRRLTLDYGMRFAIVSPIIEKNNQVSGFVLPLFDRSKQVQLIRPGLDQGRRAGIHPVTGAVFPAALIGALAPNTGDPANGLVVTSKDASYPRSLIRNRGIQYAPRIGFAFDPTAKGRTAIRGGFGIFYNRQTLDAILNPFTTQAPLVTTPVINYSTLSTFLGTSGLVFPQAVLGLDREGHVPYVMNYSLSVQHNLAGTILDVGYVGSLGRHLMWQRNINSIPFGANFDPRNADPTIARTPLPQAFLRPFPGYTNINIREFAGSSNYHSLQVSANRRFSRNLQFGASWTWSKAMDFTDNDTENVSILVPVRVWNYGLAAFDRTHVLKANWLYDVPNTSITNPIARTILNNWQLSGIASFVSGAPLGVGYRTTTAVDITGSPTDGARIVVTGNPNLPKSERSFGRNFDTSVFRLPAVGTFGNSAKTLVRGPGINNWDLAFFKNFPIKDQFRAQFRWELYNAFNHTQFTALDTTATFDSVTGAQTNARFSEFTAARNPRLMQFAIRLYF